MRRVKQTGRTLGNYVNTLYSTGISQVVKIRDVKNLKQDIKNNPIIKTQVAKLGCLLVCTFGNFLVILIAAHTVKKLDLSHDRTMDQHEGYKSD